VATTIVTGVRRVILPESEAELLELAALPGPVPAPEDGLFPPDAAIRRISGETVLLFGGGRALLLEVAHPLVAAGVAEHSSFRTDPFGRLQRTLDAMSKLTFADRATALAAARRVAQSHQRVQGVLVERVGPFAAGTPYHGRDPELVRWVWATLVDTSLVVYEAFVAPLSADDREAFYAEQGVLARLLGVPVEGVPACYADFRRYFDTLLESESLSVGAQAREIAQAVLRPPGGFGDSGTLRMLTAALLPPRLREAFALPWDEARAARFDTLRASVRRLRQQAAPPSVTGTGGGRRRADLR
jgi:uncharacterized protein (DUF2236 family)